MKNIKDLKNNPWKVYLIWTVLLIAFFIMIPILSIGSSSGEQLPFILLGKGLNIGSWGFFFLSILTSLINLKWLKKYWLFNLVIMILSIYFISLSLSTKIKYNEGYKMDQKFHSTNNGQLKIRREYFYSTNKIRSEKFWLNGKKDSVWRIFSEDGNVIKQEIFSNDTLLKTVH